MLSVQVTREIVNLLYAIAHILKVTLSPGDRRNKRWYHALAWSLSIRLWLRLHGRWYGFNHFSKISVSLVPFQCPCIVIIKPLSSSFAIPLFMNVRSILRLIVTTFETSYVRSYFHPSRGIISSACGRFHERSS